MNDTPTTPAAGTSVVTPIDPQMIHSVGEWKHTSRLLSCGFDPSGDYVFCSAHDNSIQRWHIASGVAAPLEGHDSWVRAIAFNPTLGHTYTGGYDGRLIAWETAAVEPKPLRQVEAHNGWIRSLAVSPDGKLLASCGNDNLVKLWSTDDGLLLDVLAGHDCHVYNVAFHPDGSRLVSGDLKGHVRDWDLASGEQLRMLDAAALRNYDSGYRVDVGGVRGIRFNADGSLLACGGVSDVTSGFAGHVYPRVVVFDYLTGEEKQSLVGSKKPQGTIWNVHFHPDGFVIGTDSGNAGGHLFFWKLDEPNEYFDFKLPTYCLGSDLHPDKIRMVTAHHDKVLRMWRMAAPVA